MIQNLKADHEQMTASAELAADDLDQVRSRLAELPVLLADTKGKKREPLVQEFGTLKAREQVAVAELGVLRDRQNAAFVAIFQAQYDQAEAELQTCIAEEYRPSLDARDQAVERNLRMVNKPVYGMDSASRDTFRQDKHQARVDKEEAVSYLALIVAPKLNELRQARDRAREALREVS